MRIGLSYSRCLRDIIDGVVDINEVLIIISRTDFNPHDDNEWKGIWAGYSREAFFSYPEWSSYEDKDEQRFRDVTIELYDSGRLHQPRKFGAHAVRRDEVWLEAVLPSSELERNTAAKTAWEHFQTVAGLTNVTIDKNYK
jgi:hypothetical protein